MNLSTLLGVLPVVGPIIAAAPEFKALFDAAASSLKESDQEAAKQGYDLAISRAGKAHSDLQDLVRRYGG